MTVNSPLRVKMHRQSPTILAIRSFGPPPTELWVICILIDTSFNSSRLSLSGWAVAWSKRLVGEGEFPGHILQVITSWITESWLSFSIMTIKRYFQRFYYALKSTHYCFVRISSTLLCIEMHTMNNKKRKSNKIETFTWNWRFVCVKSLSGLLLLTEN